MNRYFLIFLFLFTIGCAKDDDLLSEVEIMSDKETIEELPVIPKNAIEIGRLNAVKKAYQMTDLVFTPLLPIEANHSTYNAGETYKGLIYSSVREIGTYVGPCVSFHTFMTAIHNPRSKIYTEKLDQSPYHGYNCKAYYGTVCSGLVSYALGISYGSYDFPTSELMDAVNTELIDSVHIADVLWNSQHVAMITNVYRNSKGQVKGVEISEAIQSGCVRETISLSRFTSLMKSEYKQIYRYKDISNNIEYKSAPQFVAVLDETPVSFVYNDDLCPDKGDKACYRENEDVVINVMHDYKYLEVYKDEELILKIDPTLNRDMVLQNLTFGDYKARICYGEGLVFSDFTTWKVVNMELIPDRSAGRLYFKSENAIPLKMSFTDIAGSRKSTDTELFRCTLTDEDRSRGYIEIPEELTKKSKPYIHFTFSTDYGKIQHSPINWFKY